MFKPFHLSAGASLLALGLMLLPAEPAESGTVTIRRVIGRDRSPNVIIINGDSGVRYRYKHRHNNAPIVIGPGVSIGGPGVGSVCWPACVNYGTSIGIPSSVIGAPIGYPYGNPYGIHSYDSYPFGVNAPIIQVPFDRPVKVYRSRHHKPRIRGSVTISF